MKHKKIILFSFLVLLLGGFAGLRYFQYLSARKHQAEELKKNGKFAVAKVVDGRDDYKWEDGDYTLRLIFTTENDEKVETEIVADKSDFAFSPTGATIDIMYSPADPHIVKPLVTVEEIEKIVGVYPRYIDHTELIQLLAMNTAPADSITAFLNTSNFKWNFSMQPEGSRRWENYIRDESIIIGPEALVEYHGRSGAELGDLITTLSLKMILQDFKNDHVVYENDTCRLTLKTKRSKNNVDHMMVLEKKIVEIK